LNVFLFVLGAILVVMALTFGVFALSNRLRFREHTTIRWVELLLIVSLLLVPGIWLTVANWPSASSMSGSPVGIVDNLDEAQSNLVVDYDKVTTDDCLAKVKQQFGSAGVGHYKAEDEDYETVKFDVGAMHSVGDNGVLTSDSTNVPLNPQTREAERAFICRDPAQAAMVMNGAGREKVGDKTVAELNPWMQAQGDPSAIQPWAQHCMDAKDNVKVHLECAKTMAAAAVLVGRFHDDGVQKTSTEWNYHLANHGLVVGQVPPFELNPVQEKDAFFLVISVTQKTGGCFLRLGFNVGVTAPNGGDQRLAGLPCEAPPPPTATPPTGTKPPGTHNPPPTTTTQPPRTTTHTPPTTPPVTTTTTPPKTCLSVYGPGYSGTYPNCHKDGSTAVQPTQPTAAPGTNPPPNPTHDPGSNKCYSETTGKPVQPLPDGTCPPGSFGG
jgi:hypothetical protein